MMCQKNELLICICIIENNNLYQHQQHHKFCVFFSYSRNYITQRSAILRYAFIKKKKCTYTPKENKYIEHIFATKKKKKIYISITINLIFFFHILPNILQYYMQFTFKQSYISYNYHKHILLQCAHTLPCTAPIQPSAGPTKKKIKQYIYFVVPFSFYVIHGNVLDFPALTEPYRINSIAPLKFSRIFFFFFIYYQCFSKNILFNNVFVYLTKCL